MTSITELSTDQQQIVFALTAKMHALGYAATFSHLEVGPVITQYFFRAPLDAALSKILSKEEDLALATNSESVLISRERNLINVSVPNHERRRIDFDNCLQWLAGVAHTGIPLLMGQSPKGENFSLDLSEQPHMLIAGSTGGGKSVFISQLIASMALLKEPTELKLLLVDTKQVDLPLFQSLPHVIAVVDKVIELHTHLDRMMSIVRQRTEKMKGLARNIAEYNNLQLSFGGDKLPYYVIIIDELADVIGLDKELATSEDKDTKRTRIHEKLARLAQISRASGIHIIAATQRPSVKIISGDIKANFPTRICFKLPSATDSRVVLDEGGAEYLLGRGDYLFKTATSGTLARGHGSYVDLNMIAIVLAQHQQLREQFKYMKLNAVS